MKNFHLNTTALVILLAASPFFAFSEVKFETNRICDTYKAMPQNYQQAVTDALKSGENAVCIDETAESGKIVAQINTDNEISHLGLQINDKRQNGKYPECKLFIENLLLNIFIAGDKSFVFNYIKHNDIVFFQNNKALANKTAADWRRMVKDLIPSEMSLHFSKFTFYATWTLGANNAVTIRFPADINLIKGMDKEELEKDFFRTINASSGAARHTDTDTGKMSRKNNGLYMLAGEKFGTDDFRSDIYLIKNGEDYKPVYSEKYPAESLANLFLAGITDNVTVHTTIMMYGNKKETKTWELKKIDSFLRQNTETYFGLSADTPLEMKATIIYYNPIYQYVHMLTVEAGKEKIFAKNDKQMKTTLYLYIPRNDFKKELQNN